MSHIPFAYLADGGLFLVGADGFPRPVDSQFVRSVEERRATERQRHGWRQQGMMWNFQPTGFDPGDYDPATMAQGLPPVRFTGAAPGGPGELHYALVNERVGGLFVLDTGENYERRLLHRRDFELRDLARHPHDGRLLGSARQPDGSANLALLEVGDPRLREITAGDSVDEAPSWAGNRVLFQSAGVGRDSAGGVYGYSPYGIQELDLDNDRMSALLESDRVDYLMPRIGPAGRLLCIRRPYHLRPPVSFWRSVGDVALFPFRLLRAFVHFFNVFSMMFSRKPLLTAGGPQRPELQRRGLLLWGRWVETQQTLRLGRAADDAPLAPRDWELIERQPDGEQRVLATHVLAFDTLPDGGLLYSNGRAVFLRDADGAQRRLAKAALIERVVALDAAQSSSSSGAPPA